MPTWLKSKKGAWGEIIVSLAIGGLTTYLSPVVGVPLFVVMLVFGGYLLYGAYTTEKPSREMSLSTTSAISSIGDAEKKEITALMELSSKIEREMEQYFTKSLDGTTSAQERVTKWDGLIDSANFQSLWNEYLSQRAIVSVISPELDDGVRLLITMLKKCYRVTLSKQYMDELPELGKLIGDVASTTETIRKKNAGIIKQLIK